ncbi:MAG: hypothetical protein ACKVOP_01605 [Sphingomonadaceae bacterium]
MRTTLTIDDDVLSVATAIARQERKTIGTVVSELLRKSLAVPASDQLEFRNGFPLLPVRPGAGRATMELVNKLRDESE